MPASNQQPADQLSRHTVLATLTDSYDVHDDCLPTDEEPADHQHDMAFDVDPTKIIMTQDSACTTTCSGRVSIFSEFKPYKMDEVDTARAANGHAMPVLGEGTIPVVVPDDTGHKSTIVMRNSLFIPVLGNSHYFSIAQAARGHRL